MDLIPSVQEISTLGSKDYFQASTYEEARQEDSDADLIFRTHCTYP